MVTQKEKVTLGVRVDLGVVHQMDQIYRKFYVDKSKQIRCLLNYFLSLPEEQQKEIIDCGMQYELSTSLSSSEGPDLSSADTEIRKIGPLHGETVVWGR